MVEVSAPPMASVSEHHDDQDEHHDQAEKRPCPWLPTSVRVVPVGRSLISHPTRRDEWSDRQIGVNQTLVQVNFQDLIEIDPVPLKKIRRYT